MKYKGFTLIEVLIVVAIIGILVGIALPSYQSHIQKGNRVDAQLALTEISQLFERINARQGEYPTGADATAAIAQVDTPDIYTFAAAIATTTSFKVTATPVVGKANEGDVCGTLSIAQTGETLPSSPSECW